MLGVCVCGGGGVLGWGGGGGLVCSPFLFGLQWDYAHGVLACLVGWLHIDFVH